MRTRTKRTTNRKKQTRRKKNNIKCLERGASDKYQVGTSGFMISKTNWLKLQCLNCIEINGTFYRLPSDSTIEKWKTLPENVSIVIKASRYITHMKRLKDVKGAWEKLWKQIKPLGKKLKAVLFQLPPSFDYKPENLQRIADMKKYIPKDLNIVFEFRNKSWFIDDVYDQFKKMKWCIAGTYIQKKESTTYWMGNMPAGLNLPPRTAPFNYLRIHGDRGYRGSLDGSQLRKIKNLLNRQKGAENFVMFNNTFFDSRSKYCMTDGIKIKYAAVCNAIEFTNIL